MRWFALILFALLPVQSDGRRFEESRVSMACTWTIVIDGQEDKPRDRIADQAFAEIDRIDRLMSNYRQDSELSRINREAWPGPLSVDPELFDLLATSLDYSALSDGAFDITVGALMKTWGFFRDEGRMPAPGSIRSALAKTGYRHVIADRERKTIRFNVPGIELDLGGIAKGYAVDRAVAVLRRNGIRNALVNGCGSTIYGLGAPAGSTGWEVALLDPLDRNRTAANVRLNDRALSVSGDYEKFFEFKGRKYSHIFDPRTGRPAEGVLSVAVISATGVDGDALDNVFYVLGPRRSRELFARTAAESAFIYLSAGHGKWRMLRLEKIIPDR